MLQVMFDKGLVARELVGRTFVYRPAVGRQETQGSLVADLLERALGGSAKALVSSALDAKRLTAEELAEIRALIDEASAAEDGGDGDARGAVGASPRRQAGLDPRPQPVAGSGAGPPPRPRVAGAERGRRGARGEFLRSSAGRTAHGSLRRGARGRASDPVPGGAGRAGDLPPQGPGGAARRGRTGARGLRSGRAPRRRLGVRPHGPLPRGALALGRLSRPLAGLARGRRGLRARHASARERAGRRPAGG